VRGLATARDSAVAQRDAILEECKARLEAQATDHAKVVQDLRDGMPAKVAAEAQDRATVLAGAEKRGIKLVVEGKDTATLRREVLTEAIKDTSVKGVMDAMVPDLAKATPEALGLATAALFALPTGKVAATGHDSLGRALAGKKLPASAKDDNDGASCAEVGRTGMMKASSEAWKRGRK